MIFFSIFAGVFGNQRDPATRRVPVAVVDEDGSAYSKALVARSAAEGALRVRTTRETEGRGGPLDRAGAEALVRDGDFPVAVVLPKGLGETRKFWGDPATAAPRVQLLADVSDPIAPQVVQGLLQKVSFTAAPETMASRRPRDVREVQRAAHAGAAHRRWISGSRRCARAARRAAPPGVDAPRRRSGCQSSSST